jgi:hypothetical protein
MGVYINPPKESKEAFLMREGRPLTQKDVRAWVFETPTKEFPVALVDNGPFTAAGVAFDAKEIAAWLAPDDLRPRAYWAVAIELLMNPNVSGIPKGYLEDYIR